MCACLLACSDFSTLNFIKNHSFPSRTPNECDNWHTECYCNAVSTVGLPRNNFEWRKMKQNEAETRNKNPDFNRKHVITIWVQHARNWSRQSEQNSKRKMCLNEKWKIIWNVKFHMVHANGAHWVFRFDRVFHWTCFPLLMRLRIAVQSSDQL